MTQPENSHLQELAQRNVETAGATCRSSYWSVLQEPTVLLACSPNRPDVATAAILGYN
jgi:hypothetical protein